MAVQSAWFRLLYSITEYEHIGSLPVCLSVCLTVCPFVPCLRFIGIGNPQRLQFWWRVYQGDVNHCVTFDDEYFGNR